MLVIGGPAAGGGDCTIRPDVDMRQDDAVGIDNTIRLGISSTSLERVHHVVPYIANLED